MTSKYLPASLGTMFDQPIERAAVRQPRDQAAHIAGAFNAPELCCLVDRYSPDLLPRDAAAEVKIDGLRCLTIGSRIVTREGSPFEAAYFCAPVLQALAREYGRPMFFDGEYVEDGGVEATLAAFRARVGTGCLWLFDAVPLDEWESGKPSREVLRVRRARLRRALETVGATREGSPVGFVESLTVQSIGEVEAHARNVWSLGMEGIVIKNQAAQYVRKRACDWMKLKGWTVSDMMVVDALGCTRGGVETCRALVVRLLGHPPGRAIRLPMHGGLAETVWRERSRVVGSIVKVEHAGFTAAGNPREAQLKQLSI